MRSSILARAGSSQSKGSTSDSRRTLTGNKETYKRKIRGTWSIEIHVVLPAHSLRFTTRVPVWREFGGTTLPLCRCVVNIKSRSYTIVHVENSHADTHSDNSASLSSSKSRFNCSMQYVFGLAFGIPSTTSTGQRGYTDHHAQAQHSGRNGSLPA